MFICRFCSKVCKGDNSLRNHERLCKSNPNRQVILKTDAWYEAMHRRKGNGANQYTRAKEQGLPKPVYVHTDVTRQKISDANKKRFSNIENRKKHSIAMQEAVRKNPDSYSKNNVCGRVKNIEYNGRRLKGTWEFKTAVWLDKQGIRWETETNPQPYFWNNKWHTYFPDFWLVDLGIYIEVKGYKTERDQAKWSQFPLTLYVIDSRIIDNLENLTIYDLPR